MRRLHTTWAPRRLIALVVTGLVVGSGLAVGAPAATAAGDFYTPPAQFDTDPGAVIRSEPSPLLLQIPGVPNLHVMEVNPETNLQVHLQHFN